MANPLKNVNGPAARKMFSEMSNRETLTWLGVAFLVHVVLIGATSVGYIRDHWVDPKGAQARAKAAEEAAAAADATKPSSAPPAATTPAAAAPADQPKTPADPDAALIEKNKNNPVIKSITDTAKPSETPKTPTRNGFNFDDDPLK